MTCLPIAKAAFLVAGLIATFASLSGNENPQK